MQYTSVDERPRQFLSLTEDEVAMVVSQVSDENLKHTLQFGIGLHHAGLNDRDRSLVEELFTNTKIQVFVSCVCIRIRCPAFTNLMFHGFLISYDQHSCNHKKNIYLCCA